jgi:hypothetical protein
MLSANQPIPLTCPTCGAVLTLHQPTATFRCTLGHSFSPEQLAAASEQDLTRTLWMCLRQLEERQWLLAQLVARADAPTAQLPDLQSAIKQLREWLPAVPTTNKA